MRRGLMAWKPEETPESVLRERIERLRMKMREHNLDAFLLYTNLVRPSGVTFVTGFSPYWSDGLLLVPHTGDPILATALSKRVAQWIRSVNPISEIINSPRPGKIIAERLASDSAVRRAGILELDGLPNGLYDEIAQSAPLVELVDGSAAFAAARQPIDAAEAALLLRANNLARSALDEVAANPARDIGTIVACVERAARLGGAEEVYVAIVPSLENSQTFIRRSGSGAVDSNYAVRVSVAYKGTWVRRAQSFSGDTVCRQSFGDAGKVFQNIQNELRPGQSLGAQLEKFIARLPGAELIAWTAESSVGSYPLQPAASSKTDKNWALPEGWSLVLSLQMRLAGRPWLGAAPLIPSSARVAA